MTADAPARPSLAALLFGTTAPVDRRTYAIAGVSLMLVKYGLDAALLGLTTGTFWSPIRYLYGGFSTPAALLERGEEWVLVVLVLQALPFLWIGLTMSMRRAIDAGRPPTLALLFMIPGINYVLMLVLAALPTASGEGWVRAESEAALRSGGRLHSALFGVLFGVLFAVAVAVSTTLLSTLVFREYSVALFLATPSLIGAGAAWFYNRGAPRGFAATQAVALLSVTIAGLSLLLFAIEGAICIVMAMPLAIVAAAIGAVIGQVIARLDRRGVGSLLAVAGLLPVASAIESLAAVPLPLREVATTIVIDAPPAAVWPNVVGFAELDAPPRWIDELGVAYPRRARIDGEGPGAIRHCEFSTGAFVEPITAWEPGRRLAFDVASQPPPMHEWSPYRGVHPPHLDGYLRSRRGEFRLVDLGDGRTRLEGSTWYTLDLAPTPYWALWSDAMIHGIHARVLAHVKRLSEAGAVSVAGAADDLHEIPGLAGDDGIDGLRDRGR